jgi:hypothetical protein
MIYIVYPKYKCLHPLDLLLEVSERSNNGTRARFLVCRSSLGQKSEKKRKEKKRKEKKRETPDFESGKE